MTDNTIACTTDDKYFITDKNNDPLTFLAVGRYTSITFDDELLYFSNDTITSSISTIDHETDQSCTSLFGVTQIKPIQNDFNKRFVAKTLLNTTSGAEINDRQPMYIQFIDSVILEINTLQKIESFSIPGFSSFNIDTLINLDTKRQLRLSGNKEDNFVALIKLENVTELKAAIFNLNSGDIIINDSDLENVKHAQIMISGNVFSDVKIYGWSNDQKSFLFGNTFLSGLSTGAINIYYPASVSYNSYDIEIRSVLGDGFGFAKNVQDLPEQLSPLRPSIEMNRIGEEFNISLGEGFDWIKAEFRFNNSTITTSSFWSFYAKANSEINLSFPQIDQSYLNLHPELRQMLNDGPETLNITGYTFDNPDTVEELRLNPDALEFDSILLEGSTTSISKAFDL